jgi:hypothetical protein
MMRAGWTNWHQQDVITYLKEENKTLREKLGTKKILKCQLGCQFALLCAVSTRGHSAYAFSATD